MMLFNLLWFLSLLHAGVPIPLASQRVTFAEDGAGIGGPDEGFGLVIVAPGYGSAIL
jgi:hypothetical protein